MFAPRGGFVGRVARADEDDDEPPAPDRSFLFELAITTGLMGLVTAAAELVKERGRTERERIRQMGLERRQRERLEQRNREALDRRLEKLAGGGDDA